MGAGRGRELGNVLRNLLLKATSLGLERGARLAVTLFAAPILGEGTFGLFVFATTVTALLALAADLGLGVWTTRALARLGRDAPAAAREDVIRAGLVVRAATAVPYGVAVTAVAWFGAHAEGRRVVVLLGVAALLNGFLDHFGAVLRGSDRFADEARLNGLRAFFVTVWGFLALALARSVDAFALALVVASLGSALYGLGLVLRAYPLLRQTVMGRALRETARTAVRESRPLWIAGLLSLLYFKLDTFFVRAYAGDAELGAYGAAYKLFEGAMLLPAVVLAATFPGLVRAQGDPIESLRLERTIGALLLTLGLLVGGFLFFFRAPVIELVFGLPFRRSLDSLRVLAIGLPLVYVNFGLTHFLVARGRERLNTLLALMMLAVTVVLDAALVPRGGGPGAAAATALAEVALTLGCLVALGSGRGTLGRRRASPSFRASSRRGRRAA